MNRRTVLTVVLLVGICTGIMLGVGWFSRAQVQDEAVGGGNATWGKKSVQVLDYTAPGLNGYVARKVGEWNAALGGALKLVYVRKAMVEECAGVQKQPGAMVVCSRTSYPEYAAGVTSLSYGGKKDQKITATLTTLVASTYDTNSTESGYWWHPMGCHELGHALGLNHPRDYGNETCMGVQQDHPSAHDGQVLRKKYHDRKGHKRHGHKR